MKVRVNLPSRDQAVCLGDHPYEQPVDPRRRPEFNDSQMIKEDHRSMANLSPNFIHKTFRPGEFQPHYWMESEIVPVPFNRANKPEEL